MTRRRIVVYAVSFIAIVFLARYVGRLYGEWAGSRAIAQRMLQESENVDIPKSIEEVLDREDPIFRLAATASPSEIEEKLDTSKVNVSNSGGYTPLLFAAMLNPDPDVVELLITLGADKNARTNASENALVVAARWNTSTAVIERLIDIGFDVNGRTLQNGTTALMYAANYNENPDVIRVLLRNGADVHLRSLGGLYEGDTALTFACRFFAGGNVEKCRILIEAGSDVNARNAWGETPLIIATKSELLNAEIIKFLLESAADPHITDNEGKAALDYAQLDTTIDVFRDFGIERR